MNRIQKLYSEAAAKLEAAQTAETLDEIKALKADAANLKAMADELKQSEDELKALKTPVRPSLPMGGDGVSLNADPGETPQDAALKAVYTMRFGDEGDAIKAVLSDLYGPAYNELRYAQSRGFTKFLRMGRGALTGAELNAGRQIVLPPAYVAKAIQQGFDIAELKSTMVAAADDLGGYTVPVDFQSRVIERLQGMVVMRGRAMTMQTSRDSVEMPSSTGGDSQNTSAVRVTWVDETPSSSAAETNLTFGLERIPVHTVMATTPISKNLLEDAAFDIAGYLARKFGEAAAIDEDNQFLVGDGNGKPRGILPSSANGEGLTAVVSGAAATLTWDGLIALMYELDAQYRRNAVWMMEKGTAEVIAKLKDGTGQYLWRRERGNNATEGIQGFLEGFPVVEQEGMPTVGAGAFPIIFGDPGGYLIVDRIGMSVDRYDDSTTAATNTVKFVMRRRLGGQVTESYRFKVQEIAES